MSELEKAFEGKDFANPDHIAQYAAQLGASITNEARKIQVALHAAREKGIRIDFPEGLEEFAPMGKSEIDLIDLRGRLMDVLIEIEKKAGLKITAEELSRRMLELDLEKS